MTGEDGGPGDMNTLGRICTAQYTTAGTFAQSMAPPTGYTGCWPIGMWTFHASQTMTDCDAPPTVLAMYQFKAEIIIDGNGDEQQQFTYVTDPSVHNQLKVSQGGAGLCEGEVNLYSADGKQVFLFKPELNADNSITGDGEYTLYDKDQWQ
jgi:hypothetical protein